MELPFYLMSEESPGTSWDGTVSLHGDELHFSLRSDEEASPTEFDLPLVAVRKAEFQRGLVSRKLKLAVGNEEMRRQFPAGVSGDQVELMVARDDAEFGLGEGREGEFERLAAEIAKRTEIGLPSSAGLPG